MRRQKVVPRPYQKKAVKAAIAGLMGRFRRALVVLATGLGKTLTAALIAKKFRAKRILFLVHNNFILQHAVEEFRLVFGGSGRTWSVYNGLSKNGAASADFVFATWQTMGGNLKEWARNHFDLIVVDEAHHTEAETYKPVAKYFTGAKLGITATPDREDKADIRDVFGPEVINISLEEAIGKGWLPEVEYHIVADESLDENALQKIMGEIKRGKKRFTMAEVNRRIFIRKRDEEIARIINSYNKKTVVFCSAIDHAERMRKSLENAATFHSKKGRTQKETWDKNQQVLQDLEDGVVQRVAAVNAFNEGVNVPSVGLVAFCRATNVVTVFRQQLGRGLRPGKDKLIVLDFVGNLDRIRMLLEMVNKIKGFAGKGKGGKRGKQQKFDVSGAGFKFTFSDKVVDLIQVLKHTEREIYPTWEEAATAARKLLKHKLKKSGGDLRSLYKSTYRKDPRLPSAPDSTYSKFPGWLMFLRGKKKEELYPTWQEAAVAARKLLKHELKKPRVNLISLYKSTYRKDPRLPSNPHLQYSDFPGYSMFLRGKKKEEVYPTWQEAAVAARKLLKHELKKPDANLSKLYQANYRKDPRLPSTPIAVYSDFPGYSMFLRGKKKEEVYPTWQEAAVAARKLLKHELKKPGGDLSKLYQANYRKDPRLSSIPHVIYPDFPGYSMFLRGEAKKYPTWQEAATAARKLLKKELRDPKGSLLKLYAAHYRKDPKLQGDPRQAYSDFPGFPVFLGKKKSPAKK